MIISFMSENKKEGVKLNAIASMSLHILVLMFIFIKPSEKNDDFYTVINTQLVSFDSIKQTTKEEPKTVVTATEKNTQQKEKVSADNVRVDASKIINKNSNTEKLKESKAIKKPVTKRQQQNHNIIKKNIASNSSSKPVEQNYTGNVADKALTKNQLEIQHFVFLLKKNISDKWLYPVNIEKQVKTIVKIQIAYTGEVTNLKVIESSGDKDFDDSVLNAILTASPFEFLSKLNVFLFEKNFRSIKLTFIPDDLTK